MPERQDKIKILFRHRSMEMGGVEKVMLSLMNNLDRDKFEITVLLNLNQGELRDQFPKHVRKVYLAEGKEDFSKNKFIHKIQLFKRKSTLEKLLKNPKKIDQEILRDQYDVEIGMTYNDFDSVLNSTNKNSKKMGWFHSEINLPKLQPLVPGIIRNFEKFDYMVYCSQRTKDMMHQYHPHLRYPSESVIINAIPIEEIKKKSLENISDFPSADVPIFISIGRLHTRKGYHKLMEVHAQLLNDGFPHKVLIFGNGEELGNLLNQRKKLKVEDSFIFEGNKMNPYPYVKMADFFIMPSESEAWPLVLAEALVLQKPSIATDTGDVATMLDDGKTGILVNYDSKEIYNAMKLFLTDKNLVKDMQKNLENVEEKFDNHKIFAEVEDIILKLAKK